MNLTTLEVKLLEYSVEVYHLATVMSGHIGETWKLLRSSRGDYKMRGMRDLLDFLVCDSFYIVSTKASISTTLLVICARYGLCAQGSYQ